MCVLQKEKKTVTRRAPIFRLADADAAILCFRLLLRRHLTSASLPLRPVVRSHIFG